MKDVSLVQKLRKDVHNQNKAANLNQHRGNIPHSSDEDIHSVTRLNFWYSRIPISTTTRRFLYNDREYCFKPKGSDLTYESLSIRMPCDHHHLPHGLLFYGGENRT
jgi:hypothetical protein